MFANCVLDSDALPWCRGKDFFAREKCLWLEIRYSEHVDACLCKLGVDFGHAQLVFNIYKFNRMYANMRFQNQKIIKWNILACSNSHTYLNESTFFQNAKKYGNFCEKVNLLKM